MKNREELKAKLKEMSDDEIVDMMIEKQKVQAELDYLKEQISLLKKSRYASKSEQVPSIQLNLFNEMEDVQDHPAEEAEVITKKVKNKKKKEMDLSKLPKKIIEHILEVKICADCGSEMKELSPEIVDVLKYHPARYYVERHIIHQYVCRHCSEEINEDGEIKAKIVSAPNTEKRLIKGSLASASVVAGLAFNKFVSGTPLYRQEQELKRRGVPISRASMSNWMMRCSDDYLKPLYELMKKDIRSCEHIHMDETTVTVLEEKAERTGKNYMWLMCSGKWEEQQMAIYCYHKNREHAFAKEMIGEDYSGKIHCDGYEAYEKFEKATPLGCMAHFRRYVYEAYELDAGSKIKNRTELQEYAKTHEAFGILNHILSEVKYLFECESNYIKDKLTPEEIYTKRQDEQKERLEGLFVYLDEHQTHFTKQSKAGKAIQYGLNQKEKLMNYLNDGEAEISNNRAERSVKPFVMGRKAWLFSNTISGAESSSIYYSLIESAKMNGLDIEAYLTYIFETLKQIDHPTEADYRKVLPYSQELPEILKVKSK